MSSYEDYKEEMRQFANELRESVSMEKLLTEKYGKEIINNHTICDFHKDTHPSLYLKKGKYYHCWSCGAGREKGALLKLPDGTEIEDGGGNIFGYVMNREQVEFREALEIIAEFAGLEMPEFKPNPKALKLKEEATETNRAFYKALMQDTDALDYLAKRGIGKEEIGKWRMGMVPWDWPDKRFAGRIVFGLTETRYKPEEAQTIAMAYRVREVEDYLKHGWLKDEIDKYLHPKYNEDGIIRKLEPKYLNDKTDLIYNKSRFLYGMNYAEHALRQMKHDQRFVVLMEGYTDVIMAHKYGLSTAVACCTNVITDEQADMVARRCRRVYLWLDGDEAGSSGTARSLTKLLERGCDVLIVQSPGMDPAEVVANGHNIKEFIMKHSKQAVQLVINQELEEYDKQINKFRTKALSRLLPVLTQITDTPDQLHYQAVIQERLGVEVQNPELTEAQNKALQNLLPLIKSMSNQAERTNYEAVIQNRLNVSM